MKKQGRNIKLRTIVSDLGEDIFDQKKECYGLNKGPISSRSVLHIVDLCYLKISNQTFSNEIELDHYIEWTVLFKIIWVDCRFEDLDLLVKVFGSCNFENCKFNNLSLRKCQFSNCTFQNCQIVKCDLSRAEFDDSNFKNCEFLKSDLYASDFRRCELFQIKFQNSNLNLILARSVKVWKSK